MHKLKLFSVFALLVLLVGVGLGTAMAQAPPSDQSGPDGSFGKAEIEADRLWHEAMRPENADRREALLSRIVELYTEALLEEPPHKASVYVDRGATYSQLEEYDQAIVDYNIALSMLPRPVSADVIKNRGLVYERQGKLREALADFETFLDLIADAPSERRADERVRFAAKVEALRSKLGQSGGQSTSPSEASQRTPERAPEPNYWVWGEWLGNAKAHNDTIGDDTRTDLAGRVSCGMEWTRLKTRSGFYCRT